MVSICPSDLPENHEKGMCSECVPHWGGKNGRSRSLSLSLCIVCLYMNAFMKFDTFTQSTKISFNYWAGTGPAGIELCMQLMISTNILFQICMTGQQCKSTKEHCLPCYTQETCKQSSPSYHSIAVRR